MRAKGEGSIRHRSDGLWEARITVGFNPKTGKQKVKSLYGHTQKEVKEKLKKYIRALDENGCTDPSKMTVENWISKWIEEYCFGLSPTTIRSYRSSARCSINSHIGTIRLCDLKPLHVQALINALQKQGQSPKTIKNNIGVLQGALNAACVNNLIAENPVGKVKLPQVTRPEIRVMSEEELFRFIDNCIFERFGNLFLLALYTGMRQGEIIGLRWSQIDFKKSLIHVDTQIVTCERQYIRKAPKHNKVRTISFGQTVRDILLEEQEAHPESETVFISDKGKILSHATIYQSFKRYTERIGIKDIRFHDLRHTHAVLSLRSGADIKTIQTNLGHHSEIFTLNTYIHSTEEMIHEATDNFEKFISNMGKIMGING